MRYLTSFLAPMLFMPLTALAKGAPALYDTPTPGETTILALIMGSVVGLLYAVFAGADS